MHTFAIVPDRHDAEFTGVKMRAAIQFSSDDNTAANAGSNGNADHVFIMLPGTSPHFAQRRTVRVVLHDQRQIGQPAEQLHQVDVIQVSQRARFCRMTVMGINMARETDPDCRNVIVLLATRHHILPFAGKRGGVLWRIELMMG